MIDSTWIKEKFAGIKKYKPKLEEIHAKSADEMEKDIDLQLKSERLFEIFSQVLLDICTHIISKSNVEPPSTYSDCIKKLGELGVLKPDTATKGVSLVKMRNIIAPRPGEIDYQLLHEGLRELKEDFPVFQEEILSWIEREELDQDTA